MELNSEEAIFRLFFAVFLGSIVGLEREFSQQQAGLRTHILVCAGSAVFTIISISSLLIGVSVPGQAVQVARDPSRIAAQIVSGIGFIGGGAVLRFGSNVRGLTTAASLWITASIGMLAGTGHYRLSLVATLITFLVLFTIGNLERTVFRKNHKSYNRLRLTVMTQTAKLNEVQAWIEKQFGLEILELKSTAHPEAESIHLVYTINALGLKLNITDLNHRLNAIAGVSQCNVKIFMDDG